MEAQGYRTESYEEWKENHMRTELFRRAGGNDGEESNAGSSKGSAGQLMPEERELAEKCLERK